MSSTPYAKLSTDDRHDDPAVVLIPVDPEAAHGDGHSRGNVGGRAPRDHYGIRVGSWDAGLFGCLDNIIPNCCTAVCCPCLSVAQIAHRIGYAQYAAIVGIYGFFFGLQLLADFAMLLLGGHREHEDATTRWAFFDSVSKLITFFLVWRLRWLVRERYDIPANSCEDPFVALCCSCCALTQMATHVKSYRPGSFDILNPKDTIPAYTYN